MVYVPVWDRAQDVAERVLTAEGVAYETRRADGTRGYSRLMTEVWARGEGFIVVEHDVAPWPGAIAELAACQGDWCYFQYPDGGSLSRGLGCTKFSDRLVSGYPGLSAEWADVAWQQIDGAVGSAVAGVLRDGSDPRCLHTPPVAHARRPD